MANVSSAFLEDCAADILPSSDKTICTAEAGQATARIRPAGSYQGDFSMGVYLTHL